MLTTLLDLLGIACLIAVVVLVLPPLPAGLALIGAGALAASRALTIGSP